MFTARTYTRSMTHAVAVRCECDRSLARISLFQRKMHVQVEVIELYDRVASEQLDSN